MHYGLGSNIIETQHNYCTDKPVGDMAREREGCLYCASHAADRRTDTATDSDTA